MHSHTNTFFCLTDKIFLYFSVSMTMYFYLLLIKNNRPRILSILIFEKNKI